MSRPWRPLFVRPARSFACGGLPPRRVAGRRGARQSDKRRAAGCGIDGPAALDARHIYTDDVARCAGSQVGRDWRGGRFWLFYAAFAVGPSRRREAMTAPRQVEEQLRGWGLFCVSLSIQQMPWLVGGETRHPNDAKRRNRRLLDPSRDVECLFSGLPWV